MAIVEITPTLRSDELPEEILRLVEEAARRIEAFVEARHDDPIPAFVPSDFLAVYRTLEAIRRGWLAPGGHFLEWGSGFGVVAMLAAVVGFQAFGIEIHADLVAAARRLAAAQGIEARFVEGSFVPEGGEDLVPPMGELAWLDTDGASAYEDLEFELDEFDVVFAYPWPGEEDVVIDLFDRFAALGALLVTYQGREGVLVRRKVRRRKRR
jgi:hypothetical protein